MSIQDSFKPSQINLVVNGVRIPTNTIQTLVVREWMFDIVPRLEVVFQDVYNILEAKTIKNFDEIELVLRYSDYDSPNVRMKFVNLAIDISPMSAGMPVRIVQLTALGCPVGFIKDLKTRSFPSQRSKDVFDRIFGQYGYPKGNILEDTSDNMNWLQCSVTDFNFVKHVMARSYLSENDLAYVYIDRMGNWNYRSLNSAVSSEPKIRFEQVSLPYPFEQSSEILKFGSFSIRELDGLSLIDPEVFDCIISHDSSGEQTKKDFYESASEMDQLAKVPYVHRTNGKYVNNAIVPRDVGNTFEHYQTNLVRRKFLERVAFSRMMIVSALPHSDISLMDTVDVSIPVAKVRDGAKSTEYSGKYLVGGMLHEFVGTNTYQCQYILLRTVSGR